MGGKRKGQSNDHPPPAPAALSQEHTLALGRLGNMFEIGDWCEDKIVCDVHDLQCSVNAISTKSKPEERRKRENVC